MRMPSKISVLLAVIALLLASLAACAEIQYQPEEMPPSEELLILSLNMTQDEYGFVVIKGTVMNISPSNSSSAEVKIELYDAEETLLDTAIDSISDLGPGETWDFGVACPGIDTEEIQRYEIVVGSSW